jgi:hypothetical protein
MKIIVTEDCIAAVVANAARDALLAMHAGQIVELGKVQHAQSLGIDGGRPLASRHTHIQFVAEEMALVLGHHKAKDPAAAAFAEAKELLEVTATRYQHRIAKFRQAIDGLQIDECCYLIFGDYSLMLPEVARRWLQKPKETRKPFTFHTMSHEDGRDEEDAS